MFKTFQQKYPIFCVITTIIESIYHIKRSKPVRYAKATLTRFGSVLRGTERPCEFHLWQLHCETVPSAPRRSSHRLEAVPRPGFADSGARGIRKKERRTSAKACA